MQIQKTDSTNFQAKLSLSGVLQKDARWTKIAQEFEAKTKSFPYDTLEIYRPKLDDGVEFLINREEYGNGKHVLSEKATKNFLKLSPTGIVQKLKKIFNIAMDTKNLPKVDKLGDDVNILEKKYGISVKQETFDKWADDIEKQEKIKNYATIVNDPILGKYSYSHGIFD